MNMNNEETILGPQPGNEANGTNQSTEAQTKYGKGKKAAAVAGAGVLGGIVGAGGAYAAGNMAEHQEEEPEAQATESREGASKAAAQSQPKQAAAEEASTPAAGNSSEGVDRAGQGEADPAPIDARAQPTGGQPATTEPGEVRVVGMQKGQTVDGHTSETAILTDGEVVAVVVDADGDGTAEYLGVDENRDGQFGEDEVVNIQDENVDMASLRQAYAQPTAQPRAVATSGDQTGEVKVLGMYTAEGENGEQMEAAVLTDGERVGAVVDVDGNGYADVIGIDKNSNGQIEEGEVHALAPGELEMQTIRDAYLEQQQQQPEGSCGYSVSDDQTDYTCDPSQQIV